VVAVKRAAFIALLSTACATAQVSVAGDVATDGRLFVQAPRYAGQGSGDMVSAVVEPSFKLSLDDGTHTLRLDPFYRLDPADERRTHGDLREGYYKLTLEHFELLAGASQVTWGVLESHRPSDIVNQHDFVESLSETAKLGQPMLELGWVGETMSLKAYALPYFRDETFPGVRGRLRFPTVIDVDHPQFETSFGRWQPSGALRWTLNVGELDVAASLFSGLSREPRFILSLTSGEVVPRYDLAQQGSVEAQWTHGALTLKAEAYARLWTEKLIPFGGGGIGIDYTFFKLAGDADLSLALEFLYDSRPPAAPVTFFDHDAFAGFRFALNDLANTEVTGGVAFDVIDHSVIARLEASRRIGEHWRVYLSINAFYGHSGKLQDAFSNDSYGQARVAYFF
jgi:hypothetical protein